MSRISGRAWPCFILSVLCLKFLIFVLDPAPGLFFGDSLCYIMSAVLHWTPPDRSFTYGYLIEWTALRAHSLDSLVAAQVFASALSTVLLAYALEEFFEVRRSIAFGFGMLFAIEPIQLVYERFVMTECFSLLLFACFTLLAFHYIRSRSWKLLPTIPAMGILLISFRVSFLPIVEAYTILLPFLAAHARGGPLALDPEPRPFSTRAPASGIAGSGASPLHRFFPRGRTAFTTGAHLFVLLCLTFVLHSGYQRLVGKLAFGPPGYNLRSGYFLLAAWAPVVQPEDFPYPELRNDIFQNLQLDLKDRANRSFHLFDDGGLILAIEGKLGEGEGNRAAARTAIRALERSPSGVMKLSLRTFLDYFDLEILRAKILNDLGLDTDFPYAACYPEKFFLSMNGAWKLITPTKAYYERSIAWYWVLLFSPILALAAIFVQKGRLRAYTAPIFLAASISVAVLSVVGVHPVVRYLHPVAWMALLVSGVLCESASEGIRKGAPAAAEREPHRGAVGARSGTNGPPPR